MKEGKRWKPEEDLQLAKAYVHHSVDPVKGTDQESEQLWANIASTFKAELLKTSNILCLRNLQGLKNRWSTINKDVCKFVGYYKKVFALNESGKTNEDKLRGSLEMFLKTEGKAFVFQACWEFLKKYPKWSHDPVNAHNGKKRKAASYESGCEVDGIAVADDSGTEIIGNKKAKANQQSESQALRAAELIAKTQDDKNQSLKEMMLLKVMNREGVCPRRREAFMKAMEVKLLGELGIELPEDPEE